MRLYVTPASPWVRRVRVTILELGIEDRFEFVQTRWPHSWGTQTVAMPADFTAATPVMRIPALVTDTVTLTNSHAICDYLNAEFGEYRLLAREGAARWQALATMALANAVLEAQIMRRAETLRSDKERSADFIAKMRDRTFRCFAALERTSADLRRHLRSGPDHHRRRLQLRRLALRPRLAHRRAEACGLVRLGRRAAVAEGDLSRRNATTLTCHPCAKRRWQVPRAGAEGSSRLAGGGASPSPAHSASVRSDGGCERS